MPKTQPVTETKRPRGRPPLESAKESVTLRLDPLVVEYFRNNTEATLGSAINSVLTNYIKRKARQ